MMSRFRKLFGTTYPTLKRSFHRTRRQFSQLLAISPRDQRIRSFRNTVASTDERITGYKIRNYGALAMQRYKRFFGNAMKARALPTENRGMDQRVCTEPNDKSWDAGVREGLESRENRAVCSNSFLNNAPLRCVAEQRRLGVAHVVRVGSVCQRPG
jgi:hypothetical protein